MTDIFISYSRRDKAFVRALCDALQKQNHQIWIDWDGICSSQPWQAEIAAGIWAARFVYILSPDSVASKYCDWEVEQAIALQKKRIPVLCCRLYAKLERRPQDWAERDPQGLGAGVDL